MMNGHISLSPSEWRVMEQLWDSAPQTITQLTQALEAETGWSKHTVISFLNRMEKKGAVTYQEIGRAKAYFPAYDRQDVSREEAERFLERVFSGSLGLMVSSLVEGKNLSEEELEQLRSLLDRAEGGGGDA